MEQINLTGNVLLRHGFRYRAGGDYTLELPIENTAFTLEWCSLEGFSLVLKTIWVGEDVSVLDLPEYLFHDLEYIKTLEPLKELHLLLTDQPLVELAENDESYLQELSHRSKCYRERPVERDREPFEATGEFEPILLNGTSSTEISREGLKKKRLFL